MPETRKNSIPRLHGKGGKLLRRSHILDGSTRCFYAPGQYPETNFHKPTDWPRAGSLLRMPQVCWLNSFMELARLGPTLSQSWGVLSFEPWFDGQGGVFSERIGRVVYFQFPEDLPNGGVVVTDNAEYHEQLRLMEVFSGAAERTNGIREGRTWVYPWDWSSQEPDNPVASPAMDGFVQCPAPLPIFKPYVGTEFMNLWAGPAMLMTGFKSVFKPYEPLPDPADDFYMRSMNSSVIDSSDMFPGRLLAIRHPDVDWEIPEFDPITYVNSRGGGVVSGYTDYKSSQEASYQNASDIFDYFEGHYGDYGVKHIGVTSELTEDSVVQAVADHFGFDPDTGRDLE